MKAKPNQLVIFKHPKLLGNLFFVGRVQNVQRKTLDVKISGKRLRIPRDRCWPYAMNKKALKRNLQLEQQIAKLMRLVRYVTQNFVAFS